MDRYREGRGIELRESAILNRFTVTVERVEGGREMAGFRDRVAAEGFVRRLSARVDAAELVGFRIEDGQTGNVLREGVL